MGGHVDKVLLEFEGVPVVGHTWRRFEECEAISEIILVVRDGMQDSFGALGAKMGFRKPHRFVAGGAERQDSVWNGLGALSPTVDLVAIQDAARPCTSVDLITRCLQIAQASGAAVAAQRATDTIKESDGGHGHRQTSGPLPTLECPDPSMLPTAGHPQGVGDRSRLW